MRVPGFLLLLLLSVPVAWAQSSPALTALLQGRMLDATTLLQAELAHDPGNGRAHLLLCRVDYAQNFTDAAASECQAAAAALPQDSVVQMWLGRALGQKAAHASSLSAFGIARRVRDAFERAVQLDPANMEAAGDLSQYYLAAPAIVGGGRDKAERLAGSLMPRFPAAAHRVLALLADKAGDQGKAEAEYKAAIAAAKTPETFIDLANFYRSHKRVGEAVAAVKEARAADAGRGPAEMDAASILTDLDQDPGLAEQCLRDYLASSHQTDAAPVFLAHLALGRLLSHRGDAAGAKAEYAAAAALAPQYGPAKKAVAGA